MANGIRKTYGNKKYSIIITILCVLLVVVNIVSISFAFFTDKASSFSSIQFGKIGVDAKFKPNSGNLTEDFTFESENVYTGDVIERNIVIQNIKDAEDCAIRLYIVFELKIDNGAYQDVSNSNYITLQVEDAEKSDGWTKFGKYEYYNYTLKKNTTKDLKIKMVVEESFTQELQIIANAQSSAQYRLALYVDAVQKANNGYLDAEGWKGNLPTGWALKD